MIWLLKQDWNMNIFPNLYPIPIDYVLIVLLCVHAIEWSLNIPWFGRYCIEIFVAYFDKQIKQNNKKKKTMNNNKIGIPRKWSRGKMVLCYWLLGDAFFHFQFFVGEFSFISMFG